MDKKLRDFVAQQIPKFNPDLARGIAHKQSKEFAEYIDRDLKASNEYYLADIQFAGLRRMSPMEEHFAYHPPKDKNYIELARTDTVMYEAPFDYNGKPIDKRHLSVPFVRVFNEMWIRGSLYQVSPVIEDPGVSVTRGGLFAWLGMVKVNFHRFNYHMFVDGMDYSTSVAYSHMYHVSDRSKAVKPGKNTPRPTLMHYLMCKVGFSETLKKFFDVTDLHVGTEKTINKKTYDPEHWLIISSLDGNAARRSPKEGYVAPTPIRLAILKAQATPAALGAICSFFYIVDLFPDMVKQADLDKPSMWQRLLGIILFSEKHHESVRLKLLSAHLSSIESYINYQSRVNLRHGGIIVETFYDFLAWVITHLPAKISTATNDVASLYGKRLTVTRFLLKDISHSIYSLMYQLNNRYTNRNGRLSERDVKEILRKLLPRDKIMEASSGHAEVTTVSFPGTCMVFNVTSKAILQENADNSPSKRGGSVNDASKFVHSSVVAFCSYVAMDKNEPSGRGKLGMNTQLGPRGELLVNPEDQQDLIKLDMQLTSL